MTEELGNRLLILKGRQGNLGFEFIRVAISFLAHSQIHSFRSDSELIILSSLEDD
jgi:hypothetical protein